jgi:dTDP-glucose 4,6-dehydratase
VRILITGGAGFLGHHVVDHLLDNTDAEVVVLDKLTYASSGFDRLRDSDRFDDARVHTLAADFTKPISHGVSLEIGDVDYILHLGAETHVDNSIADPEPFVMTNVVGTMHMLNFALTVPSLKRFLYFSTDEVFGPAPEGVAYKEWDRYKSSNPYSASKAGGEELVVAYVNTYGLPAVITHCMNVFGERQHPEKYLPLCVRKICAGETVTVHGDETKAGSRFWIHARNVANAIAFVLENSVIGEKYNIVGEREVDNLEIAQFIARVIGKPLKHKLVSCADTRPGHDLRYALDGGRLAKMGWEPPVGFEESMERTIRWMLENPKWHE